MPLGLLAVWRALSLCGSTGWRERTVIGLVRIALHKG